MYFESYMFILSFIHSTIFIGYSVPGALLGSEDVLCSKIPAFLHLNFSD